MICDYAAVLVLPTLLVFSSFLILASLKAGVSKVWSHITWGQSRTLPSPCLPDPVPAAPTLPGPGCKLHLALAPAGQGPALHVTWGLCPRLATTGIVCDAVLDHPERVSRAGSGIQGEGAQ